MNGEEFQNLVRLAIRKTIQQKKKSVLYGTTNSAYRGAGGTMCPVGHMIPNQYYVKEMEGYGVRELKLHNLPFFCQFSEEQIAILEDLQLCHDDTSLNKSFVQQFKQNLRRAGL